MLTADRATYISRQRIVTEEDRGCYVILDVRVSDHTTLTRGLHLTIADRSKATRIVRSTIVINRRSSKSGQEAVLVEDSVRTEETRSHHHISRRNIVLNPIELEGLLHANIIDIGVVHIFLQISRTMEGNISV